MVSISELPMFDQNEIAWNFRTARGLRSTLIDMATISFSFIDARIL